MFSIELVAGDRVLLAGRFDASQEEKASQVLRNIQASCVIDFRDVTYISSSGLGLLVALQLRLLKQGASARLVHLSPHIRELFRLSGLDTVLPID